MRPKTKTTDPDIALTVDAEEWFHVPGRREVADPSAWDRLDSGFPEAFDRTLRLLEEGGWKATFCVLGWLAKRYPSQVRAMVEHGHEVACHGMRHDLVSGLSRSAFAADLSEAKAILEGVTGEAVAGFRAPRWSMPAQSWPYEVLAEEGFAWSSSRLQIPGLGWAGPGFGRISGVWEIPALRGALGPISWPAGGTVALRTAPGRLLLRARERCLSAGRPAVYWFHPWELIPEGPRMEGSALFRWSRFAALDRLPERLRALVPPGDRTLGRICTALDDPGGRGHTER